MVVDSVPMPIVRLASEKTYRAFKQNYEAKPSKGYRAVNKCWFIDYKRHVIIYDNRVVQTSDVTKANVHEINFLKELENNLSNKPQLGDMVYRSNPLQLELFEKFNIKMKVTLLAYK